MPPSELNHLSNCLQPDYMRPNEKTSTADLLQKCQCQSPDGAHEPFCLELFYRAIVHRCGEAWYGIYIHYYPLVRYWLALRGIADADLQDDLVQDTFMAFWKCYTTEKLEAATGLASVLAYMKSCAFTSVAQWQRRDTLITEPLPDDEWGFAGSTLEADVERNTATHVLSARLKHHCFDRRDQLVALWVLIEGIKPAVLVQRYPDEFPEVREVYRVKRNLLDRLQRDIELRTMCENV